MIAHELARVKNRDMLTSTGPPPIGRRRRPTPASAHPSTAAARGSTTPSGASIRRGEVLAEWARTSEGGGAFVFHSILVEAGTAIGRHRGYMRFERTERPEEERVAGFRSRRPLRDNSILGTSRWTLWTAGYRYRVSKPGRTVPEPSLEASVGRVTRVGGGIFDPVVYYGGRSFAAAALGLRLSFGLEGHRMGRYGVATLDSQEH